MTHRSSTHSPLPHITTTDRLSFTTALALAGGLLAVLAALLGIGTCADRAALAGCAPLLPPFYGIVVLVPFVLLGGAVLLWRKPVLPVLALFAGAVLIEANLGPFPDRTTELIPLWRNLSSSVPVPFSPAELIVIAAGGLWLLRDLLHHRMRIHTSAVLRIYLLYLAFVAVGLVLGVARGGNVVIALWEVRVPVLGGVVGWLALNLVRTQRHVEALGWIIIVGSGIKGMQGAWRYVVTVQRQVIYNNLLEHEEALFFPAFYVWLVLLWVFGGSRRQKIAGLTFLPFVLLADFANQRRASTAALVVALAALVVLLFVVLKHRRRQIVLVVLAGTVVLAGYVGVYWNSGSRLAQPIRAIKSQFIPTSRDESSDRYRELETMGLMQQIRANPIIGQGYGHELPLPPGMWDARVVAPFILYMPHNSMLWIWWRTGIGGFVVFWLTLGVAVAWNVHYARSTTDPLLQRWAIFAGLVTLMWGVLGVLDQGFLLNREVVYVAVAWAVPDVLRRLAASPALQGKTNGGK